MRTILLIAVLMSSLRAQQITWVKAARSPGQPSYNGYNAVRYDPLSHRTIHYGTTPASSIIYSTDFFLYDATVNAWTNIGGSGSLTNGAACGTEDTANMPAPRHPVGQMALDTKRGWLWLFSGLCQGYPRNDLYYLVLNADPSQDVWHKVKYAVQPNGAFGMTSGTMVYDAENDGFFLFGTDIGSQTHDNWVYCRTQENSIPGTLTPAQLSIGCVNPDDWAQVNPVGGVQPGGVQFPGMVYLNRAAILFGGSDSSGNSRNETWAYAQKTWTKFSPALTPEPPPVALAGQPALAAGNGLVYYHSSGTAPNLPHDWAFNTGTGQWIDLGANGGPGPYPNGFCPSMTYDPAANALVCIARNSSNGALEAWIGQFSQAAPPTITSAANLTGASTGNPYSVQLTGSGRTPFVWTMLSGSLPPGLSLSAGGVISGTPAVGSTGTFTFSLKVTNAFSNASQEFSIVVSLPTCIG